MKKRAIYVTAAVASLLITGCAKQGAPDDPDNRKQSNTQHPIELAAPVANAFTDFSFGFFKNLQAEQKAGDNIFVSPLSLHIALGMLVNGAEATTRSEILKALKSDHLSMEALNEAYKKLLTALPEADPLVKMTLANAIFYKNGFTVEAPFLNTMKNSFRSQINGLPFVPTDLPVINKWASDNTNGKIPKVLDDISPNLVMLLMNALYFKGDWRTKFKKENTRSQAFLLGNGSQTTVKMMNQTDTFRLANTENFTALQMPYGNGQFNATFLLPKEGKTITEIMSSLNAPQWEQLQAGFYTRSVKVGVPKFKLEQQFDLNSTLQKMGMAKAFTLSAELEGISKIKPLFVSFVKQNTFAAVDEEGTEAAAVTVIGIETTSVPIIPQFICDRPFGFIISEKTSKTILFMGRIMHPVE